MFALAEDAPGKVATACDINYKRASILFHAFSLALGRAEKQERVRLDFYLTTRLRKFGA